MLDIADNVVISADNTDVENCAEIQVAAADI